ncbi:MAG TPA: glycosyltransferase family 2 protein [Micromonosporaceae bacterium]|nr:glycosyltransferase family 2 protein [Micromonosporaceae bacterium]
MAGQPDVSVVIPTRNRPELVTRAVRSVLGQTLREIEVLVVVDGPDDATPAALAAIADPRLRVIALDSSRGAPGARNAGVAHATAKWTALLDDDDEWLPEKLAIQLDLARNAGIGMPIVISHLFVRTPRAEFILPRRVPDPGEPISEYLAIRKGLFHGDGFIQTSTIFAATELLRRVPFTEGLRRLQELDWALRALRHDGVDLVIAAEPLVIWHADENRPRVSFDAPVRESVEWLQRTRPLVTRRAYAALAMSVVSSMAAPSHDPRIFATLLYEAVRHGRPGRTDYLTFAQVWLVPPTLRRKVRDLILGRRSRQQISAVGRS